MAGTRIYIFIYNSLNHTLASRGYPTHSRTAVLAMVGNGLANLMARALPKGTEEPEFAAILAEFRAYYEAHKTDLTAPYAGIPEMLAALSAAGYRIAVVSNKVDSAVRALSKQYFGDLVSAAVGDREGFARKPAPDLVNEALRLLDSTADRAYFIGDSEVDVLTARNVGVPCLAVTWGFRTEATLREAGATALYATPAALADHLVSERKH